MPEARHRLRLLLAVVVVDLIGFGIVVPILPYYVERFGAGGTELGLVLTSFAVMQFVFAPLWGRLSDRIGRRPVLLLTIAGNTLALLGLGLADSLPAVFAARIVGGVFSGNIGVATAYIADATSDEERPRWMGLVGASFAAGFTLGPAIGGSLALIDYATPMFAAAALSALNLAIAAWRLPESPRRAGGGEAGPSRLAALRLPGVGRLFAANFVFSFSVTQLETSFALYMLRRFGYGPFEVAALLVAMAVLMGGIQGGGMRPLSKRFGQRRLVIGGAALLALGFALTPCAPGVGWMLLPLAIAAVGRAITHPSLMTLASFCAGESERGAVMGTFQSAASLARVVGPVVAGVAFDRDIALPFWIAALAALLVLLLARRLPRVDADAAHGVAAQLPS